MMNKTQVKIRGKNQKLHQKRRAIQRRIEMKMMDTDIAADMTEVGLEIGVTIETGKIIAIRNTSLIEEMTKIIMVEVFVDQETDLLTEEVGIMTEKDLITGQDEGIDTNVDTLFSHFCYIWMKPHS